MNKEKLLIMGIVLGILMFLIYPVYGLLGTVLGMTDSFNKISEEPNAAPSDLAQGISQSFVFIIAGIAFSGIGLLFALGCTVSLIKIRKVKCNQGEEL